MEVMSLACQREQRPVAGVVMLAGPPLRLGAGTDQEAFSVLVCRVLCEEVHMATNLAIDPRLLERALAISGVRTKKEAVTIALEEFIRRRAQAKIVESFGTLDWDDSYDYKEDRRSRDRKAAQWLDSDPSANDHSP